MKTAAVIAGFLVTFEVLAGGHVHVPEFAFSITQHGWSATVDAANWTCSAYVIVR